MSPLFLFRRKPIFLWPLCGHFGAWGVPNKHLVFRSLCGAKYNACYFCCAMAHIFFAWAYLSAQAFDAPSANLERQRLISDAASVGGISLTLQRNALNHHRCQYSKLVRRSYCAVWAAVWWNVLLYINREIWRFTPDFCKSLHFVHDSSPYRINSTAYFYAEYKQVGLSSVISYRQ